MLSVRPPRLAAAHPIGAYLFAVGCIVLATALRGALQPYLAGVLPFSAFYPAVLLATLVGGAGPGSLALMLGGVSGWFFFIPPEMDFALPTPAELASLCLYAATAAILVAAAERLHERVRLWPAVPIRSIAGITPVSLPDLSSGASGHPAAIRRGGARPGLTFEPVEVDTLSEDHMGYLVRADGQLVAVLVRLEGEEHEDQQGLWLLEAGFGPCAACPGEAFRTLDDAESWVRGQVARAFSGKA